MNNEEIILLKRQLVSIKNEMIRLNDYLILNMNTITSQKINKNITQKINKLNNLIEKVSKLETLLSKEYI